MISQHNLLNKILISMNIGPLKKNSTVFLFHWIFYLRFFLTFIKVCFYNIHNEVLDINSNLISFWTNFWRKNVICFCSWRVKRTNWRICCIITWWRRGTASSTTSRKCRWLTGATSWSNTRRSWNRRTRNSPTSRSKPKVGGPHRVRPNKIWMWSCAGTDYVVTMIYFFVSIFNV